MTESMPGEIHGLTRLTQMVALDRIDASGRLRPVNPDTVQMLVASIAESGQKRAATLRPGPDGGFILVAGAHRLAAFRLLGRASIEAKVLDVSADEARIIEIDENLIREDLSALHFALSHQMRKEVYLKLQPETAHGKASPAKLLKAQENNKELNIGSFKGYAIEAAKASRFSVTTIKNAIALADGLSPETIAWLETSPLASNASQIKLLAAQKARQGDIVAKMRDGNIKTVGHALVTLNGGRATSDPQQRLADKAWAAFLSMDAATQAEHQKAVNDHLRKAARAGKAAS